MAKSIIAEGKTTNEAIENGLKQLKASKKNVDIKILENEDKRSFFSILEPRVVKVELTLKDEKENIEKTKEITQKKEIILSKEEKEEAIKNIKIFFKELESNLLNGVSYTIEEKENRIYVSMNSENIGYLIGYRGETLYAMQNILSAIAGKNIKNKIRVVLDIEGYKEKREKTLEELAQKVAKTVIKTKKPVKLEPMQAYERKIIHSKLQSNEKIETTSIGEEPNRRIVISLKNK